MSLISRISDLATRVGQEFNSVRGEIAAVGGLALDGYEPTGWPDRTKTTLSYNVGTRTVTLTAGAQGAPFYSGAQRFELTPNQVITLQHPNTQGVHFFYFDGSTTLQTSTTAWNVGSSQVPVAAIYYNSTTGQGWALEERHGIVMDGQTHKYLHETQGTQVTGGFALSGYTLNPANPVNSDNDFDVATGDIADEDLESTVAALTAGAGAYRVWYRSGAAGLWQWDTTDRPFTVGTTYLQYNQFTGGTWQKTDTANSNWVNMWVVATPSLTAPGIIIVMGQAVHTSLAAAQAEAFNSLQFGAVPFTEFAALWRVTYRMSSNAAYNSSTGRCRIEAVSRIAGTTVTVNQTTVGSHAALAGLSDANVHPAASIATSTTNFNGILSASDTTVQQALDDLDDHVHAQYAPLASPALTGTPTAPTAAVDTNTTQVATTAYVIAQAYLKAATATSTYAPKASPTFTGTVTVPLTAGYVKSSAGGVLSVSTAVPQADVTNLTTDLAAKAPLSSPTFTGVPAGPTAAVDTNTTQLATTAYVVGQGYIKSATAASTYAPLASPTFTGTVVLPATTSIGNVSNTELGYLDGVTSAIQTQLNGKAASSHTHAQGDITNLTTDLAAKAPLASPALTGTPTAPTAAAGTNTTQVATTAFVATAMTNTPDIYIQATQPATFNTGDFWVDTAVGI